MRLRPGKVFGIAYSTTTDVPVASSGMRAILGAWGPSIS